LPNMIGIMVHLAFNSFYYGMRFISDRNWEKPFRNRDHEFVGDIKTKEQVMELWELGWETFLSALKDIDEEHLLKTITIRNEPHSVIEAIERQMYHYSYHVGQIIYIAKHLKSGDWKSLTIPRKK
jgi:hypothetical protein